MQTINEFMVDIYVKTEDEKKPYKKIVTRFFKTLTGCFDDLRTIIDSENPHKDYFTPYKYVISPIYREDGKNAEEETHKDL